ncbi:protein [Plasmopara halstedii]|uniref:Protein n=1 Tax=Plasmopara halstedii TaxID=4781 RepID=A0A0P1ADT9_PLAHL|nr:protein [Plasmopara halstedii]CEG38705.1 protein [Plasmopara halstedii]|eukprot:XP_024575074.1 protein [Plasmopara halstedii]
MQRIQIQEVLPKTGLVYSERGNLTEVLCKPKIMPIKSATLLRIEEIDKQARAAARPATSNTLGGDLDRHTTSSRK